MTTTQIKADQLAARKARETVTATLLTTLLGEIQTKLTKLSEDKREAQEASTVQAVVKFFLDKIVESKGIVTDPESIVVLEVEESVLKKYQPKFLTVDEIVDITEKCIFGSIGEFMGFLKKHHAGEYQGQDAKKAFDILDSRKWNA